LRSLSDRACWSPLLALDCIQHLGSLARNVSDDASNQCSGTPGRARLPELVRSRARAGGLPEVLAARF